MVHWVPITPLKRRSEQKLNRTTSEPSLNGEGYGEWSNGRVWSHWSLVVWVHSPSAACLLRFWWRSKNAWRSWSFAAFGACAIWGARPPRVGGAATTGKERQGFQAHSFTTASSNINQASAFWKFHGRFAYRAPQMFTSKRFCSWSSVNHYILH